MATVWISCFNVKGRTFGRACVHCKLHALRSFCYFLSYGGESYGGTRSSDAKFVEIRKKSPGLSRG